MLDRRAEGRIAGLKRGRRGGDVDALAFGADGKRELEVGDFKRIDVNIFLIDGLEPLGRDGDAIDVRVEIRDVKVAGA